MTTPYQTHSKICFDGAHTTDRDVMEPTAHPFRASFYGTAYHAITIPPNTYHTRGKHIQPFEKTTRLCAMVLCIVFIFHLSVSFGVFSPLDTVILPSHRSSSQTPYAAPLFRNEVPAPYGGALPRRLVFFDPRRSGPSSCRMQSVAPMGG